MDGRFFDEERKSDAEELPDEGMVLIRGKGDAFAMACFRNHQQALFLRAAGVIENLCHIGGDQGILLALDKEHGNGGLFDLLLGGIIVEVEAGLLFADLFHMGQDQIGRQVAHITQLVMEHIPGVGEGTVRDDALDLDRQVSLAGGCADSGTAHGDTVENDLNVIAVGLYQILGPVHTVQTVQNAEADVFAFAGNPERYGLFLCILEIDYIANTIYFV